MALVSFSQSAPLLFGLFLGIVVSLCTGIVWNVLHQRAHTRSYFGDPAGDTHDEILIGLLILAAFGLGAFLTYALLNIRI